MIRKFSPIILFYLLLYSGDSFCQTNHYDTLKATKFLQKYLLRGYHWQLLSDEFDYTYFSSRREFKTSHRLKIIPVYEVLKLNDSTFQLKANYSVYKAFIFKGTRYLDVVTAWDIKLISGKRAVVIGPDGYGNSKLFKADKMDGLFYFERTNRRYRIFKDNGITYIWSDEKEEFSLDHIKVTKE